MVRAEITAAQYDVELQAQGVEEHLVAVRRIDLEQQERRAPSAPCPHPYLVAFHGSPWLDKEVQVAPYA